jgi:di/tricarboxylate transporter
LAVVAIWHKQQAIFAPAPPQPVYAGDILLTIGREERVTKLTEQGMKIGRDDADGHISPLGVRFVEVLLDPHSEAQGKTLKELGFRSKYGFTAVALQREGRSYRTDVADFKLQPGDSILMVGARERLQALKDDPNFIVLEPDISDQPTDWNRALLAVAITLGAVIVSILGMPVYLAMLIAAILVVVAGLLSMEEAYRTMEWPAIFLIAGMYSLSLAMVKTGLAAIIGQGVVSLVTPFGPLGLAAGAYLLSAVLTQVMGGQVTALVTAPITISAAISLGVNPQAIAVATAIGCSASFLTPIAHPVNVLMIGPGNYKFDDFFRVGWILTVICFIMLIVGMILFWRL